MEEKRTQEPTSMATTKEIVTNGDKLSKKDLNEKGDGNKREEKEEEEESDYDEDEEKEKITSLTNNTLRITRCGTPFVNGIYHRVSGTSFIKKCRHPYTDEPLKLEITQIDLESIFEPYLQSHHHSLHVSSSSSSSSSSGISNFYEKELEKEKQEKKKKMQQNSSTSTTNTNTNTNTANTNITNTENIIKHYNKAFVIRSVHPCPVQIHYYICSNDGNTDHWLPIAGLKPTPNVSPINDIAYFFKMPFYPTSTPNPRHAKDPYASNKKGILQQEMDRQKEDKERKIEIKQWHKHLPKNHKMMPVETKWVYLGMGLHGGRALMMDVPVNWTVWDVIREVCDANDCSKDPSHPLYAAAQAERAVANPTDRYAGSMTGLSPWSIRLICHDPNTNYATFIHFRFYETLRDILQTFKEDSREWFREHGIQPIEKSLSTSTSPYFEMYELSNGRYSYQSKYRPCYTYAKDGKPPEYALEKMHPRSHTKENKDVTKKEMDFHAIRVWGHQIIQVMYGDDLVELTLEHCSPGCVCWTDDLCGYRIAYILEHMLNIHIKQQGYVMGGKDVVLDYLDETFGQKLWQHDGQMIVFKNFKMFNELQKLHSKQRQ